MRPLDPSAWPDASGKDGPEPPVGSERRLLAAEILIVLSLSLLASAVFSIIDLVSAPLRGVTVSLYPNANLGVQLADLVFGTAPVALVFYLARRDGAGLRPFGLQTGTLGSDVGLGAVLGLAVATVGLGVYLGSVALGVNRFVVPAPPPGHWWTVPILLLGAVQAGLLEEVVVTGYLIRRLRQIGWPVLWAVGASALLRGSYHLYQGWGGFAGNLALGLLFGTLFIRWRRTWPLVTAHALIDALAGIGYLIARAHYPQLLRI